MAERQKDIEVSSLTTQHLRDNQNYILTDYVPKQITANNDQKLSSKSIHNIYVGLSAFFHWASDEFQIPNPMKRQASNTPTPTSSGTASLSSFSDLVEIFSRSKTCLDTTAWK